MNKCQNCNVNVYDNHTLCPLCHCKVGEKQTTIVQYPIYKINNTAKLVLLKRLFAFITIVTILITVFINIFTLHKSANLWSVTIISSFGLVWCVFSVMCTNNRSTSGKIFLTFILVSIFLIIIDFFNGSYKWSTTYVIPFLTIATTLIFSIFALRSKKSFSELFGYIIALFILSFCLIILYIFNFSSLLWTSLVASLFCIIVAIGLYIKSDNQFKLEFKKKFHL